MRGMPQRLRARYPCEPAMPELTVEHVHQIVAACREHILALSGPLNACFEGAFSLEAGEPAPWNAADAPPDLHGPGILVVLEFDEQAVLCAIPESMPLPVWFTSPDAIQAARLDTLALEWSSVLAPPDRAVSRRQSLLVFELLPDLVASQPAPGALLVPLRTGTSPRSPALWLLGPVTQPPRLDSSAASEFAAGTHDNREMAYEAFRPPDDARRDPLLRLLHLPVPVVVKLAEKRIQLGQLLAIGPGAIVSFDKSCEDLLDLCVNNQLYARGEAVKIGEKFGLKISQIGPQA